MNFDNFFTSVIFKPEEIKDKLLFKLKEAYVLDRKTKRKFKFNYIYD